jgi:hypothetical protein
MIALENTMNHGGHGWLEKRAGRSLPNEEKNQNLEPERILAL